MKEELRGANERRMLTVGYEGGIVRERDMKEEL
jgi:hypothetical protein